MKTQGVFYQKALYKRGEKDYNESRTLYAGRKNE